MSFTIEHQVRRTSSADVAFAKGAETRPTQGLLRELRNKAFRYATYGRLELSPDQHTAIERFVAEKIETVWSEADLLESVDGAPGQVAIEKGDVVEVYGRDEDSFGPKFAELVYPAGIEGADSHLVTENPGIVASAIYHFRSC